MTRLRSVAALFMAVMSVGVCSARDVSPASLHRLLVLSGTAQQVQQIPVLLRLGLQEAKQRVELQAKTPSKKAAFAIEFTQIEQVMNTTFRPADIMRIIAQHVTHNVSEQDARAMLAWFQSPTGRRISQAEENASTPQAYRQMIASARTSLANRPRVHFAIELDKLLHITKSAMTLDENNALAMFTALAGAAHPGHPVPTKAFRETIAQKLQQARPKFEMLTIITSVYTYRHIPMTSLHKYLTFLKTPGAMRFNKSLQRGLETGIRQAMTKLAKAIVVIGQRISRHAHTARPAHPGQP